MSYLPLVALLAVGTAVLAGLSVRRSPERVAWRAPLALAVVVSVGVGAAGVEQVTSDGEGNLARWPAAVADGRTPSAPAGRSIMAEVLTGPWYARWSYERPPNLSRALDADPGPVGA